MTWNIIVTDKRGIVRGAVAKAGAETAAATIGAGSEGAGTRGGQNELWRAMV